jgi:hypothetical protein
MAGNAEREIQVREKKGFVEKGAGVVEKKSYVIGAIAGVGALAVPFLALVAGGEVAQIMFAKTVKENEKVKRQGVIFEANRRNAQWN